MLQNVNNYTCVLNETYNNHPATNLKIYFLSMINQSEFLLIPRHRIGILYLFYQTLFELIYKLISSPKEYKTSFYIFCKEGGMASKC
jgi:hypothetical protein